MSRKNTIGLLFLAALLSASMASAQSIQSQPNSSSPFSDLTHVAVGVMDSFLENVAVLQQYFIRIPAEQLKLVPPDVQSTNETQSKLRGNLLGVLAASTSELVKVNILVLPTFLEEGKSRVQAVDGVVKSAYSIGNVVSAEVPASSLLELASAPEVISIWPERSFHTSLDTSVNQIHAPVMWNAGYTGTGITIAILDTGMDSNHPMLTGRVVKNVSFTGDSSSDVIGHGTHVAGIAAGKQNGANTYNGVAPDAQLFNVKVLGNNGIGAESWIIAGINYALNPDGNALTDDGADILNLSFGGPYTDLDSPVVAAVESAIANGAVVVVAAGNCGPGCPSADCQGFVGVETPGDASHAITVGAVDDASLHACFSSGGIVNGQVKPDVVAPGVSITSSYLNGSTTSLSGTSMAAPHVSGLAALLLQANPGLSPENAKYILEQSAQASGSPGKDVEYGSGLVDGSALLPSTVLTLLEYTLSLQSPVLDMNQSQVITLTAASDNVSDVTISVTHPNQLVETIPMNRNGLTWTGSFSNATEVGTYVVDANVENVIGSVVSLSRSFAAKSPSTTGAILSHDLPVQANHGQLVTVNVQFQNTGAFPTEVLVELQEWNDDLFEKIRFGAPTSVSAGQTVSIPVSWTPWSSVGNKLIKMVATFDDTAVEVDQNVFVVDADNPVLWNVQFPSSAPQWQPVSIAVRTGDLTPLTGTVYVTAPSSSYSISLLSDPVHDFNQTLNALIETPEAGNYSFTLDLCDGAATPNCITTTSYSFAVSACTLPSALIVLGDENGDSFAPLAANYCLAFWTDPAQTPTQSFLNSFPLVYWDAGTSYANAIDDNASLLLQNYPGNIVLEGENIAFRHVNDTLMHAVIHADFNAKYSLDVNSMTHLAVAHPHVIFQNISTPFPFNLALSRMNPDGVVPLSDAVALADWDANGSGIVAYQNGPVKHLFLSFSTHFLDSTVRQNLHSNIFQYMFLTSGPDATVTNSLPTFDPVDFPYPGLFQVPGIIPTTQYLTSGGNTIAYSVTNVGTTAFTNLPFDVRVDGNTQVTPLVTANPAQTKRMNAALTLSPGMHLLQAIGDPSAALNEPNSLNNSYVQSVWVAPPLPNAVPVQVEAKYSSGAMTVKSRIANYGSMPISQLPVRLAIDGNTQTITQDLLPGESAVIQRVMTMPRKNISVSVFADPANLLSEADESDNVLQKTLYFCTKSSVLIVDDDSGQPYVDVNASSVDRFDSILKENGYCTTTWRESTQGIPTPSYLNTFPIVVWSAGDYWSTAIDANDVSVLSQYSGSLWVEGSDVGFDHGDDNFMHNLLHADMNADLFLPSGSTTITNLDSTIFPGLSTIDVNTSYSSFPDSFTPYNGGSSAGKWSTAQSALISYSQPGRRTLLEGFSLDSAINLTQRNALVAGAIHWLSLAGNQPPISPTGLTCNGGACAGNYSGALSLACFGSTDSENDALFYSIDAHLSDSNAGTSSWWDANWGYRVPITLLMSGTQSNFRTSVDIDHSTLPDSVFWNAVSSSFSDVRFVKDGILLPYYRATYGDGNFASFWIKLDADAGPNRIDMYFGNPNSSYAGVSNPTDLFLVNQVNLVDDFDDNTLTGWTIRSGTWQETGAMLLRTGGSLSEDQITKDWLQQGSSFYLRAQARPTSTCANTEIALTRDVNHAEHTYLDEFFGMNADNACPPYLYARTDLDHSTGTQYTVNSNPQLSVDAKAEVLISRTGWMGAFISDVNAAPFVKVSGWEDTNHWYPYLSVANHGGGPSEADEIYTGNAPNHAYDLNLTFESIQTPASMNAAAWQTIGGHDENGAFSWNLSALGTQNDVGLRCRATDVNGSGFYSAYYTADQNISIN